MSYYVVIASRPERREGRRLPRAQREGGNRLWVEEIATPRCARGKLRLSLPSGLLAMTNELESSDRRSDQGPVPSRHAEGVLTRRASSTSNTATKEAGNSRSDQIRRARGE